MVWTALIIVLQVIGGIIYANLLEWIVHKYFLHGVGQNKKSKLSFHWYRHHRLVKTKKFLDPEYSIWFWKNLETRGSEIFGLVFLGIIHVWVAFLSPWVFAGSILWIFVYYFVHKYSHMNTKWGKKWLRWHYDHHMGVDQNKNWAVTFPLWDYILGTRVKYEYDEKGRVVRPKKRAVVAAK